MPSAAGCSSTAKRGERSRSVLVRCARGRPTPPVRRSAGVFDARSRRADARESCEPAWPPHGMRAPGRRSRGERCDQRPGMTTENGTPLAIAARARRCAARPPASSASNAQQPWPRDVEARFGSSAKAGARRLEARSADATDATSPPPAAAARSQTVGSPRPAAPGAASAPTPRCRATRAIDMKVATRRPQRAGATSRRSWRPRCSGAVQAAPSATGLARR